MRDYIFQFLRLWTIRTRRLIFWMWMISSVVIVSQTIILHSRHGMPHFMIPKDYSFEIIDTYKDEGVDGKFSDFHVTNKLEVLQDQVGDSFILRSDMSSNKTYLEQTEELANGSTFVPNGISNHHSNFVVRQIKFVGNKSLSHPLSEVSGDLSLTAASNFNSTYAGISWIKKKMPPVYLSVMNNLLLRSRASNQSLRPRWPSSCDKQLLAEKVKIENAPVVHSDRELYAPVFRNISMFKRSYELMEHKLKIYVYKEGENPIFHQPLLKGIYASEGWFMKLMEKDRHYVVKDPRKAHLFYLPFSSRQLQFALYTAESHYHNDLEQYVKNYVAMIATKYPFWNRTGGADHFLVACHDWAPFETRDTTGHSIRALCNADLRSGFQIGKDISLPETNVLSPLDPLRGLGGRSADKRTTLAFYAGKMHGGLRPKLLRHWENKDSYMKVFGLLPGGPEKRKIDYIRYMKTSKYCLCPRGHEVNSPRVVESIFYECVPVIISNNYVLPFFEVLNWEAFSVVVPEKHVPRLKNILESISEDKYMALQKGVRKVQKHFLWHNKPVKYDLYHMILHSIWFNRLYQV